MKFVWNSLPKQTFQKGLLQLVNIFKLPLVYHLRGNFLCSACWRQTSASKNMNTLESCFIVEIVVEVDIKCDSFSCLLKLLKQLYSVCVCVCVYLAYLLMKMSIVCTLKKLKKYYLSFVCVCVCVYFCLCVDRAYILHSVNWLKRGRCSERGKVLRVMVKHSCQRSVKKMWRSWGREKKHCCRLR